MPTTLNPASPSLYTVIMYTYTNNVVKSRFYNMNRDVIRTRVLIKKVVTLSKDRLNQPTIKYEIFSSSYPQYKPYNVHKIQQAKKLNTDVRKQKKYKHTYPIVLELEDLRISAQYKIRTGSQKKWDDKPSQSHIKSVYNSTKEKWIKKCTDRKTKKVNKKELKELIENHKKSAKYLDKSDYNSRVNAIMGDFYFREAPILRKYGMLYGKCWYKDLPQGIDYPFFNKHELSIIFYLLKTKKIENDCGATIR